MNANIDNTRSTPEDADKMKIPLDSTSSSLPSGNKLANKFLIQSDLNKMEKSELIRLLTNFEAKLSKTDEANIDLRAKLLCIAEERDLILEKYAKNSLNDDKLKEIQNQIAHKDDRIIELNNVILEKERQIIDLQEICSEQGKVAQSKSLAFGIVNKRLKELDAKQKRDASTETDFDLTRRRNRSMSPRRNSPGRAIPQFKIVTISGNGSPPPLDPVDGDGCSSYTTETYTNLESSSHHESPKGRKIRKKVAFDVIDNDDIPMQEEMRFSNLKKEQPKQNVATFDYEELLTENDNLRQIISEMEKTIQQKCRNAAENEKTAKPESLQILKIKAAAQAQIKKLEGVIIDMKQKTDVEIVELKAIIEQLKDSREWILNENAKLQEKLANVQEKCDDLHQELDASLKTTDMFRKKLDDNARRLEIAVADGYQNRAQMQHMADEKAILTNEVERLKEAIFAQDEFISLLEGDLVVYEAHVGILRDSLGASKKEDRQHIKSKAFTAKISALETEKQEIAKKNNEEKLRAKALAIKLRYMEEERDALKAKLRHFEREEEPKPEQPHFGSSAEKVEAEMRTQQNEKETDELQFAQHMKENLAQKIAENEYLIDERHQLVHKITDMSNQFESLSRVLDEFFASFSQNQGVLFDGADVACKLETIQRRFAEADDENRILRELRDSLLDSIDSKEKQIELLKADHQQTVDAHQRVELRLNELDSKHQAALEKIAQSEQIIASFEQRNADLSSEVSKNRSEMDALEDQNKALNEKNVSLGNIVRSMGEEIDGLHESNGKIAEKLHSANQKCESYSAQLADQRRRQDKLITVLTEIVNRFKEEDTATGFDAASASLDEFIKAIGAGNVQSPIRLSSPDLMTPISPQQQHLNENANCQEEKRPIVFSKSVSLQVNMPPLATKEDDDEGLRRAKELEDVRKELGEEQSRTKSLEFELAHLQQKLSDNDGNLKQIEVQKMNLVNERDDLLRQLAIQKNGFETELDNARKAHSLLIEEFDELRNRIEEAEARMEQQQLTTLNSSIDVLTQTEVFWMTDEFVQSDPPNFYDAHSQTDKIKTNDQHVQMEKAKNEAKSIQTEEIKISKEDKAVQNDQPISEMDPDEKRAIEHSSNQQQQSDDREEFERHLGDNVQQLVELKTELESSVDVLKGEIWSLNSELKKRFNERDLLKIRMAEMEKQIVDYKTKNEELNGVIQEQTGELANLKEKLEGGMQREQQMQTRIEELHSLMKEKTCDSNKLLAQFKQTASSDVHALKEGLEQLKRLQLEWQTEMMSHLKASLQACCTETVKQHEAARLTTKTRENDALLKANEELIETNARLQMEIEELQKEQQQVMEKETLEKEIHAEMCITRESSNRNMMDGLANIVLPFGEKVALEADIDMDSAIRHEEEEMTEKKNDKEGEEREPDGNGKMANEEEKEREELNREENAKEEGDGINEEGAPIVEDWKWDDGGDAANEDEEDETGQKMKQPDEKRMMAAEEGKGKYGEADDWGWGEEEDAEEEDGREREEDDADRGHAFAERVELAANAVCAKKREMKKEEQSSQQQEDEWAWNEDEEEEEEVEEEEEQHKQQAPSGSTKLATGQTANTAHQPKVEKNVRNLFEDW